MAENQQPIPYKDFAKRIKEKYPDYSDVDDLVLSQKMVEKYPEYKSQVLFDDVKKKEPSSSAASDSQSQSLLQEGKNVLGGGVFKSMQPTEKEGTKKENAYFKQKFVGIRPTAEGNVVERVYENPLGVDILQVAPKKREEKPKEAEVKAAPAEKSLRGVKPIAPSKYEQDQQGWLLNMVSALDKGVYKTVGTTAEGLGTALQGVTSKITGGTGEGFISDALIKFGDSYNRMIDELTPQDESFKGSLSDQLGQALGFIGSLAMTGGLSSAAKAAGGSASARNAATVAAQAPKSLTTAVKEVLSGSASPTAAVGGLTMGQAEFDRAKQAGATDEQAFEAFYKNAAIGSVLEQIPVMHFLKRFNQSTSGGVINYIKTKGVAGLTGGVEEMTTEMLQQLYANKTAKDIYNTNQDLFEGVAGNGGIGFSVGFLLNAMGTNAKILRKEGKVSEAKLVENQIQEFKQKAEENPSTNTNTVSTKIAVLGKEEGAQKALLNLEQDFQNGLIDENEYNKGVQLIQKAAAINDTIPQIVEGEKRATSIELINERNTLEEQLNQVEEQKKAIDPAFHSLLDADAKQIEERVNEINKELGELAVKQSKTESDAVQEQTAGEVPVQSETTVSEEVEGGIPKTELEEVAPVEVNEEEVVLQRQELEPPTVEGGRKVATISGLTEEERVEKVEKRKKSTTLTKEEVLHNDLVDLTNQLGKARGLEKANTQAKIRQKVLGLNAEAGFEKYRFDGVSVRKRTESKTKGVRYTKINRTSRDSSGGAIKEDAVLLTDRSPEFTNAFESLVESNAFEALQVDRGDGTSMTKEQIQSALEDVLDGIPSVAADNLLNTLEEGFNRGFFDLRAKDLGIEGTQTVQAMLDEFIGAEKEVVGEPMDEEALLKFLEEESKLESEEDIELLDNIENLITEYESEPTKTITKGEVSGTKTEPETRVTEQPKPTESGKGEGKPKAKVSRQPDEKAEPKGEDVSNIEEIAKKIGVSPKNLKDLYNINRTLFGLDRLKSLASAIAMDRMIGVMAKRAGVSKSEMYSRLNFSKATEQDLKNKNVLWQGSSALSNFESWKGGNELLSGADIQDAKTGQPIVVRVYHGTTNDFYEFDSSVKGNVEGHLGKVNYFTSDYQDAANNYQADGADLTGRIDRKQEEIESKLNYDYTDEKGNLILSKVKDDFGISAKDFKKLYPSGIPKNISPEELSRYIAEKELKGGTERVLDVFVKLNNPIVLGSRSTWFETLNLSESQLEEAAQEIADENDISIEEAKEDYEYDIRDRAIENTGGENLAIEALTDALNSNGYDATKANEILGEDFYDTEIDLNELEKKLRKSELYENELGEMASSQVIADFFKNLGFDGIILTDVSDRFKNMGIGGSTSHIHVFDDFSNQIKLADGSNTSFGETRDIRFQKNKGNAQGAVMVSMDGQAVIYALTDPNVSTPMHELAHVFEHYLTEEERNAIVKNAGTKGWTTETSEYFARGFEKYLSEGKSPIESLNKVFAKFKQWLTDIYNGIKDSEIDIKLNKEMTNIYDKMLGKQEAKPKAEPQKISDKAREQAAKLRSGEANVLPEWLRANLPKGTKKQGLDINEVYANALEVFAETYDKLGDFKKAVDEAFKGISDWFKENGIDIDEADFKAKFEAQLKGEKVKDKEPLRTDNKSILTRVFNSENISESVKEKLKDKLKYQVASQEEARSVAKEIIAEFGYEDSVTLAESGKFSGDVNSMIFAEAIDNAFNNEAKAKTLEDKLKYAEEWKDIVERYDESARDKGRFISAIQDFYKKSPLGIIMLEESKRKERFEDWYKPKEKTLKEVFEAIKEEPEFKELIQKQVQEELKKERAENRKARRSKIEKFFDDAKFKGDALYAVPIPPKVINSGLELMKQAFLAGESVVNSVEVAIDYITKEVGTWDKDKFRKEYEEKLAALESKQKGKTDEELTQEKKERILDKFRNKLKGLSESEKEEVIRKAFKKLVENGALEYQDFKDIIAETLGYGEMTEEEAKRITELVNDINSVETIADEIRQEGNRTIENIKKYKEAKKKAEKSATELAALVYNKPNILKRLLSIMQLNTLGIPSLVNNPLFNIFNQATVRLPIGVQLTALDQIIYGASKIGSKLFGTSVIYPENNIIISQGEFFRKAGEGASESASQLINGLTSRDYFQKEVYASQIQPFTSAKDLWDWKFKGKKLTPTQIADKTIQATVGLPAEVVARLLNIGDKPQRYAAEGAKSAVLAKEFGLGKVDYEYFLEFPKEEAFRYYKQQGLSDEAAMEKAEKTKEAIIKAGDESVFQQDNLLNDAINAVFEASKKYGNVPYSIAQAVKMLNFPYLKIPLNAFWSVYNLVNPEVAFAQSAYYSIKAIKTKDSADIQKAKVWAAHGTTGMALLAIAGGLVAKGIVNADNDDETTKKERMGEKQYEQQKSINVTKLAALLQGKDPDSVKHGLNVDLKYFANMGSILNTVAIRQENMTKEQKEASADYFNTLFANLSQSSLELIDNGVFSNASALVTAFDRGGNYMDNYLLNLINMAGNIVQPAMFAQHSRAQLPYYSKVKADTFYEEVKNNILARSSVVRALTGKYPPSQIGIWGDKLERKDDLILKWFGMSNVDRNNFAQPIYDDYKKTKNTNFLPPSVKPEIDKQKLTVLEAEKLEILVGNARKALIAPYINDLAQFEGLNKRYSELSEEQKLKVLDILYDLGYQKGKNLFIEAYPKYKKPEEELDVEKVTQDAYMQIFKIIKETE